MASALKVKKGAILFNNAASSSTPSANILWLGSEQRFGVTVRRKVPIIMRVTQIIKKTDSTRWDPNLIIQLRCCISPRWGWEETTWMERLIIELCKVICYYPSKTENIKTMDIPELFIGEEAKISKISTLLLWRWHQTRTFFKWLVYPSVLSEGIWISPIK